MWFSSLSSPLPNPIAGQSAIPAVIPQNESDNDSSGSLGSFQPGGPTTTSTNAFFQSLGTNGRSCFTCHQPAFGMSVSASSIAAKFALTGGNDPVFAPVDGSNCPSQVNGSNTSGALIGGLFGGNNNALSFAASHSLVMGKGLFRIFLPIPDGAEFSVSIVSDPYGCETDPNYASTTDQNGVKHQILSMYRRPLISANMKFVDNANLFSFGPPPPGASDIMWDGREPSLQHQAIDATLGHAQATQAPTTDQVNQIVAFESGIFSAQAADTKAGNLFGSSALGALGGPQNLSAVTPGNLALLSGADPLTMYASWQNVTGNVNPASARASIFRGQQIFNHRPFTVIGVSGFNDVLPGGGPAPGTTCATCHNEVGAASDLISPPQRDLGIGGDSPNLGGPSPSSVLPIFKLTCPAGTTIFNGTTTGSTTVVTTNDPGQAMISGKCADIGKFTAPALRALAGHAPFFSDGSAPTLADVVSFYNKRFNIGLSAADKQDLANFLAAL